jgi:SLT domain-containing protein
MPNEGFLRPEGQYESLQKEFDEGKFKNSISNSLMPSKAELEDGNIFKIYWNYGIKMGQAINEALGLDSGGFAEKLKAKSSVEYYDPYSNLTTNSLTTSNLTKDATTDVGDSLIFGSATKDIDSIATSGLNFTAQLIDTQRLQIQEFMSVLAASEMGTPLKDAVTSLEAFMSFINTQMKPLVVELTTLVRAANSLFGLGGGAASSSPWSGMTVPSFNNSTENTLKPHVAATGAMLVEEISPVVPGSGQPVQVISAGTENAMTAAGSQIKSSLASGFANLIMNNNSNARAMITNTLSQVGTNLMTSALGSIFGLANGGVLSGGFKAFANGGTVSQPTLGLVGEGKYNEAVVPLPDGRSIPVTGATGSTENNITVNVTIDSDGNAKSDTSSGMDGDSAKQLGYMVSQAVQMELVDQKRPGGLLSQY